jgi:hypothetical protein
MNPSLPESANNMKPFASEFAIRFIAVVFPFLMLVALMDLFREQQVQAESETRPPNRVLDAKEVTFSSDLQDPFPMPLDMQQVKLMQQTAVEASEKSAGCICCHKTVKDPHFKETLHIGCTDCHGGNAQTTDYSKAHIHPRYPQFWKTAANPERSYTLLNHESPEFIRFMNPGDFRISHISCGTTGCHSKEVATNRKQLMSTGAMLWGAALYNNGTVPIKRAVFGEAYSMNGSPLRLISEPPPTEFEMKRGVVATLDPLPRFEMVQPANVLRIFEKGGRFRPEVGIPERLDESGRTRVRLAERGLGTQNRTDPVPLSATKTRLFDPTLNFLGTNDHPGDYRSSGCTACHVIYANDRSRVHSGPYAKFGKNGQSFSEDPTISKQEPGHPIEHRFVNSIPSSQCMVCHIHPGTTVMNSYFGYMWWDEETHAEVLYPSKQKKPTAEQTIRSQMLNPNESAIRNNLSDPDFLHNLSEFNPIFEKTQFADFNGHGWAFRAVYKRDKKGALLDFHGNQVTNVKPSQLNQACEFANQSREFHQKLDSTKPADELVAAEKKLDECRSGAPVHLLDIHLEKGMHCVDCHFVQDMHGNNRLHMEVRAGTEIQCIDCHGTSETYTTLKTSGPASYTSAADGKGRNLQTLRTPFKKPRFEVIDQPDGRKRFFQNSMVEKDLRWEIVQTADTIDPSHPRYNQKAALAKTVRMGEDGKLVYGDVPKEGEAPCAHQNKNMSCIACHSSWNPSCFGCHLPQKANMKMPQLHAEGEVSKNYVSYNFQTLREDVYMLARDGDVTNNRIGPARSSCAIHVGSYNSNRESVYVQQQTISAEGFSGTAFSTNVPHTVRGKGAKETKQCTDCHVSKANDNNAWMSQLLMQGTNYVNLIGRYAWVASGEHGFHAVEVTEATEPQAVFGSAMHRFAYPDNFRKHQENRGRLQIGHEHPGRDIRDELVSPKKKADVKSVQVRGEYIYCACGSEGMRVFDVAFVDNKAFSERVLSSPVSPAGQRFHVKSRNAMAIALPTTTAVDPTRSRRPENKEGPIHPYLGYAYIADADEGLITVPVATTIDGNPSNNFLERETTFNPDGVLSGASAIAFVGTYAYIGCQAGLVIVDMCDPKRPKLVSILGTQFFQNPRAITFQFRYAYVCDDQGIKVLDISDLANPVAKSMIRIADAKQIYLARTYAYVAAGSQGLMIFDITNPEMPKLDQCYNANGQINDLHDVKLGITYNSEFAYLADGKNGMRIVQLTSPETPGNDGFSPRPTPCLIATYPIPEGGHALAISKGLDRDRAVDEMGNQIGVFGRVGARPFNRKEMEKMYKLPTGEVWRVSDDPKDLSIYQQRPYQGTPLSSKSR